MADWDYEPGVAEQLGIVPPTTPRAQVTADQLRTKPKAPVRSSSITSNANAINPQSSEPYGPPASAAGPGQPDYLARLRADQQRVRGQIDAASAPPDYEALKQQALQRGQGGRSQLMLALAAQQAGEQFAPISGHFLKQAAAARAPMKVTGGEIDPETGQVMLDPGFQQEQKIKRLEAEYAGLSDQERKFLEAQDKIAERRFQTEEGSRNRQAMIAAAAAGRERSANAAGDKIGARVYDDFMRNTKDQQIVLNAHNALQATAKRADAASDLSFIFQYMKMLDPNSVVRETEFANAQNAAGVPDQIRNLQNRILRGERLGPGQREQFLATAANLAGAAEARVNAVRGDLARQMEANGLDPTPYLPGYRRAETPLPSDVTVKPRGAPAAAPAPAAPAAIPEGVTVKRKGG